MLFARLARCWKDFEPAHPYVLADLGLVLADLHGMTRDEAALEHAVDACTEALRLASDPRSRAFAEAVLGSTLVARHGAVGDFDDLDRGVSLLAGAIESGQLKTEQLLAFRGELGNALAQRYQADQRRREDLDKAIALDMETVRLLSGNPPEKARVSPESRNRAVRPMVGCPRRERS